MRWNWRRRALSVVALAVALCPLVLDSHAAGAYSDSDPIFPFSYTVDATTHVKKFDQTINVPGGSFVGGIDLYDGSLQGALTLPTTQFTFTLAGVGLVTATAKIVPTQLVTGMVDFSHLPNLPLTATAVFNIRILDAHAVGTNINLVSPLCKTAEPVSVTMSAMANLGGPTSMSGEFTIPPFTACGNPVTTSALTLAISGPGNTFSASATPS
jgi:hypothetical protein